MPLDVWLIEPSAITVPFTYRTGPALLNVPFFVPVTETATCIHVFTGKALPGSAGRSEPAKQLARKFLVKNI